MTSSAQRGNASAFPALRRLRAEDFPEEQADLIGRLNGFMQDAGDMVQRGQSLENMNATIREFTITIPDPWVTPTLLNSWTALTADQTPQYMVDSSGFVCFRGAAKDGTAGTDPIFTLPEPLAPSAERRFFAEQSSAAGVEPFGVVTVDAAGDVRAPQYAGIQDGVVDRFYLDEVRFQPVDGRLSGMGSPFPYYARLDDLTGAAIGVVPLACRDVASDGSGPRILPVLTWERAVANGANMVKITRADGLFPGFSYVLTIVIFGG